MLSVDAAGNLFYSTKYLLSTICTILPLVAASAGGGCRTLPLFLLRHRFGCAHLISLNWLRQPAPVSCVAAMVAAMPMVLKNQSTFSSSCTCASTLSCDRTYWSHIRRGHPLRFASWRRLCRPLCDCGDCRCGLCDSGPARRAQGRQAACSRKFRRCPPQTCSHSSAVRRGVAVGSERPRAEVYCCLFWCSPST